MQIYVDATPRSFISGGFITDYTVHLVIDDRRTVLKAWHRPDSWPNATKRERVEKYVNDIAGLLGCDICWSDEKRYIMQPITCMASSKEAALIKFREQLSIKDVYHV